ncbi:MAG: hypothetical protein QM687_06215 [Ferruginibacter sp.]
MKRSKTKQTATSQYIMPLAILLAVILCTILFHWRWLWTGIVALLLLCRWVYNLQGPKRTQQNIEEEKQCYLQRKLLKQQWVEKRKVLGKENQYETTEAFWQKYSELGLAEIEQKLKVGYRTSTGRVEKDSYSVGDLLYDVFLSTTPLEKKREFSSTQSQGYTGESTGGQSAGDFGGGSSGGGGAST